MLAGRGFNEVYNLAGGIRAWDGNIAIGGEELGLELFTGNEAPDKSLLVAYSLEQGLRDFYLSMMPEVESSEAKKLFEKLADIEILHQKRIFAEYLRITGETIARTEFEKNIVVKAVEGGLTTEEYIKLFQPDWEDATDIVATAMSIEAQALDLYQRASRKSDDPQAQKILLQISSEEQAHLKELGKLLERL